MIQIYEFCCHDCRWPARSPLLEEIRSLSCFMRNPGLNAAKRTAPTISADAGSFLIK
jgi:hypothetical protein